MKTILLSLVLCFAFGSAHAAGDEIDITLCAGIPERIQFIVKNEKTLLRFFNTESGKLIVTRLEEDVIDSGYLEGPLADEVTEFAAMEYGATISMKYRISVGNPQTKKISQSYIVLATDLGVYLLVNDKDGLSTLGSHKDCEKEKEAKPGYIRDDLS